MIPPEAVHLRDLILAEARSRGVPLEEHLFGLEHYRPVLRLRLGGKILWGCWVGLPDAPNAPYRTDVITVHGSGYRSSRMWPRKTDGTFRIEAITDHVLALVGEELSRPRPDLDVPVEVPAASSGLHVVHLAGVRLGALPSRSRAEDLIGRIESLKVRERVQAHLHRGGLTDGDMRALGDAAGMYVGRPNTTDDIDPLEPINDRILTALALGEKIGSGVERRFVLIVEHRGDEVEVADPAAEGLTTVTPSELRKAWKLGARRGRPWTATISVG